MDDTACPDDGLTDERRDLRTASREQLRQRCRVRDADVDDLVDQRPAVAGLVAGDPGQRRSPGVHPVVAVLARDDDPLGGLAHHVPVAAGQLGRRIDRVRAAGAEEHDGVSNGASADNRAASWTVGSDVYAPNDE